MWWVQLKHWVAWDSVTSVVIPIASTYTCKRTFNTSNNWNYFTHCQVKVCTFIFIFFVFLSFACFFALIFLVSRSQKVLLKVLLMNKFQLFFCDCNAQNVGKPQGNLIWKNGLFKEKNITLQQLPVNTRHTHAQWQDNTFT